MGIKSGATGAAVVAGVLLLGACAINVDGTAVRSAYESSSSAPSATADLALLDPGPYRTEPSAPFGAPTEENILDYEGQRMSQFVVLPFEVDPELTVGKMPTMAIKNATLHWVLPQDVTMVNAEGGMLYGFSSTAVTPTSTSREAERSLVQLVMRYESPELARERAKQMHEVMLKTPSRSDEKIAGMPDSFVSSESTTYQGMTQHSFSSFTPHGEYVIHTYAAGPPDKKDWAQKSLATALELQKPLIDKFPGVRHKGTPAGAPNVKMVDMLIDENNVLIYAVPETDPSRSHGNLKAVYGPRGLAHNSTNPPLMYKALTDAGALYNGVDKTVVYRADSEGAAQKLYDTLVDDLITHSGYTVAPSPPGLPGARCVTKDTADGTLDYCTVRNGRYIGEASARDDKTQADQLISAQYLILQQADQDAE